MLLATVVGSASGIAAVPWALVEVQLVVVFTLGALIARRGDRPVTAAAGPPLAPRHCEHGGAAAVVSAVGATRRSSAEERFA